MSAPRPDYVDTCTETVRADDYRSDVLIIGDSISLGYTPFVQQSLPQIDVLHNPCNAGHSYWGVNTIDKYLASRERFEVITFNFGIWDGFYGDWMSSEEYAKNLRYIAFKIKQKTSRPVFITTTFVTTADQERMLAMRNAALQVMSEMSIPVVDLYPIGIAHPEFYGDDQFHFNETGYQHLAEIITQTIKGE